MQRPKYKLVCTAIFQDYQDYKVGDIITTADDQTHFGGPWGWMQDAGCAEWQENTETLVQKKKRLRTAALEDYTANLKAYKDQILAYLYADGANQAANLAIVRQNGATAEDAYAKEIIRINGLKE